MKLQTNTINWSRDQHPAYPDTNVELMLQTRKFLRMMRKKRLRANSEGTKSKVFSS